MTKKGKDITQMGLFQNALIDDAVPKTTLDFEATLTELEKIVTELDGEVKLEQALSLFDRGMKLSSECQKFLQAAEQQVELLKKNADGSLGTVPFNEEDKTD